MDERRKYKRTEMISQLIMKRLDDSEDAKEVDIEILDISKTGLGFNCTEELTMGSIYESHLTIWTKEVLNAFLLIVRIVEREQGFYYGASFVGMPELDAVRIANYQIVQESVE